MVVRLKDEKLKAKVLGNAKILVSSTGLGKGSGRRGVKRERDKME